MLLLLVTRKLFQVDQGRVSRLDCCASRGKHFCHVYCSVDFTACTHAHTRKSVCRELCMCACVVCWVQLSSLESRTRYSCWHTECVRGTARESVCVACLCGCVCECVLGTAVGSRGVCGVKSGVCCSDFTKKLFSQRLKHQKPKERR